MAWSSPKFWDGLFCKEDDYKEVLCVCKYGSFEYLLSFFVYRADNTCLGEKHTFKYAHKLFVLACYHHLFIQAGFGNGLCCIGCNQNDSTMAGVMSGDTSAEKD